MDTPDPVVHAELVVGNGRQSGARRPLKFPVTVIGSTKGCDVQLDVDSVRPVHCLIASGPNGPHLRAWAGDDTFVNDEPVETSVLCNGDTLRVGPFEFEIRVPKPTAEKATAPPIVDVEKLLKQLGEARALFRREKAEHERAIVSQRHEISNACNNLERREEHVVRECTRLLQLRKRFIKRWKKHWETQRKRVDNEWDAIERSRNELETERAEFEREGKQLRQRGEVESRRLEYGWEQLRTAERSARNERARLDAELDQRQKALADEDERLKIERDTLGAERMRLEHRAADLRIEADGIESRVVNLRAILLQLEYQRTLKLGNGAEEFALPAAAESVKPQTDGTTPARETELAHLADDLADQRLALLEQSDHLAAARQTWREEESRVLNEMADLAEQLRRREDSVDESEVAIAFEEKQLENDRTSLQQLRERLEAWQSRLVVEKAEWRAEAGRLGSELRLGGRQLERREKLLNELCRRWSERRRLEVLQLQTEHRRCEKIRREWAQQLATIDSREMLLSERERNIAARALTLEQARQQLLEKFADPELAEKRLERLGRHIRTAMSKAENAIANRWQCIGREREQCEEFFRQSTEKIAEAAAAERSAATKTAEVERREFINTQREIALAEAERLQQKQREIDEVERRELTEEIERLAGLLLEAGETEMTPLARAA